MVAIRIEYTRFAHTMEIAGIAARSFTIERPTVEVVEKGCVRPTGVRLVALAGERVVGFVASTWYPGAWSNEVRRRHLSIVALAVDAPYRRQSIGRMLLNEILERGGARGACSFTLMVQVENAHAIHLYESMEFKLTQRAPNAYGQGLDGLVMARPARPENRGAS